MMLEMLILFIIITIILFLLTIDALFFQDSPTAKPKLGQHIGNWRPVLAYIPVNLIFIVLCAYGMYNIEWFYNSHYWSGNGTYQAAIYSTTQYNYYAIVFYAFFMINCVLLVKAGYDAVQDGLSTEGEMNYRLKNRIRK